MQQNLSNHRVFWFLFGFILLLAIATLFFRWIYPNAAHQVAQTAGDNVSSQTPLKISIDQAGVYELSLEALKTYGLSVDQADLPALSLSNRGQPVPFWVDEDQGKLHFYGLPSDSRYTHQNIYLLQSSPLDFVGTAITQLPRSIQEVTAIKSFEDVPAGFYHAKIRLEENLHYNPRVEAGDTWIWQNLTAPQAWTFPVKLNQVVSGPAYIRLNIWSSTEAPVSPDHHLLVSVNDQPITDLEWDGKSWQVIEKDIQAGVLQNGMNEVKIELPGDTGAAAEAISLDWIELIYPIELVAIQDRLDFTSSGGPVVLQGFSGAVDIFDITDPKSPVLVGEKVSPQSGFTSSEGQRYMVVGANGYLNPLQVTPMQLAPDLKKSSPDVEYLAVGPPELLQPLQTLLDWREAQGLRTMAIPVQAIYDQFNDGMPEPQAIRNFLDYAFQHWEVKPRYLTLVGDATFDPQGFQADGNANQLPTYFVQTRFGGETASDFGFSVPEYSKNPTGLPGTTSFPDIAVGRIPARTAGQVRDYVQKVMNYEAAIQSKKLTEPSQKRVLAIADGSEPSFRMDADNFVRDLPENFRGELLTSTNGEAGFSKQILDGLNQGNDLVVYFGHGAINMWGKDRLFTNQNVEELQNPEQLPILLQLTCLTGFFTHPEQESLAEAFLLQPKTGAAAVLAPSSLTLPEDQSYLSYAILAEMITDPQARLGEILRRAQSKILAKNPDTREVVETFLLFGDPALQINPGSVP